MSKKWTEEDLEKLVTLKMEGLTFKQITKYFDATENALKKVYNRKKKETVKEKVSPKVLLLDIETLPIEAYVWDLFDQNIGLEMIKKDWSVLSFSAKWLGAPESEIMYYDTRNEKDVRDDSKILKIIHSLLCEADVAIHQNGIRFDIPKLNARFLKHKMHPPSSFRNIDTLRIMKRHFKLTSNKLAYATELLCTKYKKLSHSEFAGAKLWTECMKGNPKAFASMEKYNKYDVLSLEELYEILAPWDKTIRFSAFNEDTEERCTCGSTDIKKNGFIYTNTAMYQRYTCKNCGKEYKDPKNIMSKENKKKLR